MPHTYYRCLGGIVILREVFRYAHIIRKLSGNWLGGQDLNLQSATPTCAPKVTHANLQSAPLTVWIPPSMWQFTRVKYYLVLRRTEPNVSQRRNASHTQRAKIAKTLFHQVSLLCAIVSYLASAAFSRISQAVISNFVSTIGV